MEILILVLSLIICLNFILKQTENTRYSILITGLICFLFVGLAWPWAIEQSRTEISAWLSDRKLATDLTILLTLDVFSQMMFCWEAEKRITTRAVTGKKSRWIYTFLRWFPGILFFPVLFSFLEIIIFSFPGISFSVLSWSFAALVTGGLFLGIWIMRKLLPEREIRLELLYQTSWIAAVLGFIATLNGQSTVAGVSSVDWKALAGVLSMLLVFGVLGWQWYCFRLSRKKKTGS